MIIFCYPSNFRIKSKADAAKFPTLSNGAFHWTDGDYDYWLEVTDKKAGKYSVTSRPVLWRGSIFNPCFEEQDPIGVIWKTRKYINRELSGDY